MLQLDPKKRITADEALRHPWVKGSAAKNEHMAEAQNKIKEFNAARKMRVCHNCCELVIASIVVFSSSCTAKL